MEKLEIEQGCHTIQGTIFDNDRYYPKKIRRTACFNADTGSGCCMALCERGYRCQTAAKYKLTVDENKITEKAIEKVVVSAKQYATTTAHINTEGKGFVFLCTHHTEEIKTHRVVASFLQSGAGQTFVVVSTGALTAGAVALVGPAVGFVGGAYLTAALGTDAVQKAITASAEKIMENVSGSRLGDFFSKFNPL